MVEVEKIKGHGIKTILRNGGLAILTLLILFFIVVYLKKFAYFSPYLDFIEKGFYVILVLIVTFFVSKAIGDYLTKGIKAKRKIDRAPKLVNKFIYLLGFIVAGLIILNYFQIALTPILTALGIVGIALGLALQPTLSNFFAGLIILSEKSVQIGDHLEIGDLSGYVEDINWRATTIRTLPNNMVIVPNSKLIDTIMTNHWSPDKQMAALVQVGVDYGSDLKKVEKVTIDVAKKIQKSVSGAVEDFEPFIRYHTFADSNINFTVILRVREFVDKYLVTHEFIKALKERYDKEGIEISWPIRKNFKMGGRR